MLICWLHVSLCCFFFTAPSIVPIMHQISSTMNSFTLSWPQPEQPNGIILDYELRYYEKVSMYACAAEVESPLSPSLHMQSQPHALLQSPGCPGYLWAVPWVDNAFCSSVPSISPTVLWFLLLMKWIGWPLLQAHSAQCSNPVPLWKCIASRGSRIDLSPHTQYVCFIKSPVLAFGGYTTPVLTCRLFPRPWT